MGCFLAAPPPGIDFCSKREQMEELDRILAKFTDPVTGSLHGVIFTAIDKSGNVIYNHAAGKLDAGLPNAHPLRTDSLCWMASMTKLVTAVSVMQLVERGLVTLDADVRDIVPELKDIRILKGFEDGTADSAEKQSRPLYEDVAEKLTLRHLLCHVSGFVYDGEPNLQRWSKLQGRTAHTFSGSMEGYTHPLLFQPGTSWGYGAGLDWAGRVVECVTGTTLEQYMQANIWSKLGAKSTTFHPELHRHTMPPQMGIGYRVSVGQGVNSLKPGVVTLEYPLKNDLGGIGLFSTSSDFMKLLSALMKGGGPLLSSESVDLLFRPQLTKDSRVAMPKPLGLQMRRVLGIKAVQDVNQADHAFAGTVTLRDVPNRRRSGSVNWSGLPNLHWWIDPKSGIAAGLFTQILPLGDVAVVDLLLEMEEALYRAVQGGTAAGTSSSKL